MKLKKLNNGNKITELTDYPSLNHLLTIGVRGKISFVSNTYFDRMTRKLKLVLFKI